MYPSTQDIPGHRTQLFSVVGAAYVPERRSETDRAHENEPSRLFPAEAHPTVSQPSHARPSEAAMAGLWLVFYVVLIGVGVLSSGGAAKLLQMAASILR